MQGGNITSSVGNVTDTDTENGTVKCVNTDKGLQ